MPAFPNLISYPDSTKYGITTTDPAMRHETEGGYSITRKRFKRTPPLVFRVGYTQLSDLDKNTLLDFYNEGVGGGSVVFAWLNHEDGKTYQVRFKEPLEFNYAGIGLTKLWNCSMVLAQA